MWCMWQGRCFRYTTRLPTPSPGKTGFFKELVMRVRHGFLGSVVFGLLAGQAFAQAVDQTSFLFRRPAAPCASCGTPVTSPLTVTPPETAKTDQPPLIDSQPFAQAPAAGGEAGLSFNPAMFGDLGASSLGRVA